MACIICDKSALADNVIEWRVNEKGVSGIFACCDHRDLFERGHQDTADVLTRVDEIRKRPEFRQ